MSNGSELACNLQADYSTVLVQGRVIPFLVELDLGLSNLTPGPGENQRFCYQLTGVGEDEPEFADLSHWVLSLCPEITEEEIVTLTVTIDGEPQPVDFGPDGNVELFIPPAVDPPTGCSGLKFDFGLNKIEGAGNSVGVFCFELTTPFPVGDVEVCLSGGGQTARGLSVCGPVCRLPLILTKECPRPSDSHFTVGDTVTITLRLTNVGDEEIADVTVTDVIRVPDDITISSLTVQPPPTSVTPSLGPYSGTDVEVVWTGLTVGAGEAQELLITFTILAAPARGSVITNLRAGINGTTQPGLTCVIPVINAEMPLECEVPRLVLHVIFTDCVVINNGACPQWEFCGNTITATQSR